MKEDDFVKMRNFFLSSISIILVTILVINTMSTTAFATTVQTEKQNTEILYCSDDTAFEEIILSKEIETGLESFYRVQSLVMC